MSAQFRRWANTGGEPVQSLVNRRNAEGALWQRVVEPPSATAMALMDAPPPEPPGHPTEQVPLEHYQPLKPPQHPPELLLWSGLLMALRG